MLPTIGPEPPNRQQFGRYRVIRRLGSGGMGHVFEAEDQRLGRRVAIKVMNAGLIGDDAHRRRFLREAKVAASVSHPALAGLFDIGEDPDGTVWLVMELALGRRARDLVRRAPHPLVMPTAIGVAHALAALHRAGLVHRDLKPENVHVDDEGRVKVLDFGLARSVTDAAEFRTGAGAVAGTPLYMAPELWRHEPASAASDVYAFGVLLHEMVTGTHPWAGWSATAGAPAPGWRAMPEGLEALVEDCVRVDAAARPPDGAALVARLEPLLALGARDPAAAAAAADAALAAEDGPEGLLLQNRIDPRPEGARTHTWDPSALPSEDRAEPVGAGGAVPGPSLPTFLPTAVQLPTTRSDASAAPVRSRWRWLAIGLVAAAGLAVAFALRAPDASPGLDVTELPNPAGTEAGRGAWKDTVEAQRRGHRTRALSASAALVEAEPDLAAAWLRRGLVLHQLSDRAGARSAVAEAAARADRLSSRDRLLLSTLAPAVLAVPADREAAEAAARAAVAAEPRDAELRLIYAERVNNSVDVDLFRSISSEALALDPEYAWVRYLRAKRFANFGLEEEAASELAACADGLDPAPICLRARAQRRDLQGRCDAFARDVERELGIAPRDADALLRRAGSLLGAGRPPLTVLEALRIARAAATTLPPGAEHAHRAKVAAQSGDFAGALAAIGDWEASVATEITVSLRMPPRWLAIRLLVESGDMAAAADLAETTLALQEAWTDDRDSRNPERHWEPALRSVSLAAGRTTGERFDAWRLAWEEDRLASPLYTVGPTWFWSRGLPVRDRADAEAALAALPRFRFELGPLLGHTADPTLGLGIARVQRLAGAPGAADALANLADRCDVLDEPLVPIHARAEAARLAEEVGDRDLACRRWQQVIEAWASATPPSRTAEEARTRLAALSCATAPR